jgi:hypothetical protein
LLAHGQWFSPGTLASSTTKTGGHDRAEIVLKVALNTKNQSLYFRSALKHAYSREPYKKLSNQHISQMIQCFQKKNYEYETI